MKKVLRGARRNSYMRVRRVRDRNARTCTTLRRWNYAECDRLDSCSRDPIGFEGQQWNVVNYVANRPVTLRDPFGLAPYVNCVVDDIVVGEVCPEKPAIRCNFKCACSDGSLHDETTMFTYEQLYRVLGKEKMRKMGGDGLCDKIANSMFLLKKGKCRDLRPDPDPVPVPFPVPISKDGTATLVSYEMAGSSTSHSKFSKLHHANIRV